MNYSIYGADRTTPLKVVVVALISGILVAGFGILMDEGLTARVMKTGKPVMVTTSNKNVKS
jgi:RsiW-degrading membrane proteinase PrsW (M82 family)